MDNDTDDDYDHVSEYHLSASEDEHDQHTTQTPSSTPPVRSSQTSDLKILQCPYQDCPKTFNRQARLKEHLRSHTNDRVFKCPFKPCQKDYLRDTHLKHHIKSAHSQVRDYKCTWSGCDQTFATGTRLRRHLDSHQGRERHRCRDYPDCNETFRKKETLQKHIAIVHQNRRPYPCPDNDSQSGQKCDKGFDTAEKLRQHRRINHDPSRFSCSDCLAQNAIIMAGDVTHADVNLLPAFFTTYSELQQHMAEIHPPTCPYCPTSFTTAKELKRHLELQHDVKDPGSRTLSTEFKCHYENCDKSYSKRGNLNVHIKTAHENRKEFTCGQTELPLPDEVTPDTAVFGCGRSFTTKASLEEHVRTAHLALPSKRQMREKKRKADTNSQDESRMLNKKSRAPLFGKHDLLEHEPASVAMSHLDQFSVPTRVKDDIPNSKAAQSFKHDDASDEEREEDYETLSGSMTMLGGQLFHSTGRYNYTDGEYPKGHLPPDSHAFASTYGHARDDIMDCDVDEDDGFFDNFEHEPEPSMMLDPRLLQA